MKHRYEAVTNKSTCSLNSEDSQPKIKRRDFLRAAGLASLAGPLMLTATCTTSPNKANPRNQTKNKSDDPAYNFMPSKDEIFGWVEDGL